MKIPFFPAIGAGDFSAVINLALYELGSDEQFLIRALLASGGWAHVKNGEWDIGKVSCTEWVWICEKLCLPLDCISIGYQRMTHVHWVGEAVQNGTFTLPRTEQVRRLVREFMNRKKTSIRFEADYLGDRLRKRARFQRYREAKSIRKSRRKNLVRLTDERRFFQQCFLHRKTLQVFLPSRTRREGVGKWKRSVDPGLTTMFDKSRIQTEHRGGDEKNSINSTASSPSLTHVSAFVRWPLMVGLSFVREH